MKNSIDVFYFSVLIPLNIFFVEDGKMGMIVIALYMYIFKSNIRLLQFTKSNREIKFIIWNSRLEI